MFSIDPLLFAPSRNTAAMEAIEPHILLLEHGWTILMGYNYIGYNQLSPANACALTYPSEPHFAETCWHVDSGETNRRQSNSASTTSTSRWWQWRQKWRGPTSGAHRVLAAAIPPPTLRHDDRKSDDPWPLTVTYNTLHLIIAKVLNSTTLDKNSERWRFFFYTQRIVLPVVV